MQKILAITPKLPQASLLDSFSHCLDFLSTDYKITWVDSLEQYENRSFEEYDQYWKQKIANYTKKYDVFVGFSLGGVLLQHNLDLFSDKHKIFLFSPPSIIDTALKNKLETVLEASVSGNIQQAIHVLHTYVYSEEPKNFEEIRSVPWTTIASRVEYGLRYVLQHTIPDAIKNSNAAVYQLIGEHSKLVTVNNIYLTPHSVYQTVPHAGNRVLEDNPDFCQAKIREWLDAEKI